MQQSSGARRLIHPGKDGRRKSAGQAVLILMCDAEGVTDEDTFIVAVEQCPDLPKEVREAARRLTVVEVHSFKKSLIHSLDTQILLNPAGASWTERLKKRRDRLARYCDQRLLRSHIGVGGDMYTVEVNPDSASVVYWERYEDVRKHL